MLKARAGWGGFCAASKATSASNGALAGNIGFGWCSGKFFNSGGWNRTSPSADAFTVIFDKHSVRISRRIQFGRLSIRFDFDIDLFVRTFLRLSLEFQFVSSDPGNRQSTS